MVGFDEIDLVMEILNERTVVAYEVRHYVPVALQDVQLIVHAKLEGLIDDLKSELEPSFLEMTGTGPHASGCACCIFLLSPSTYRNREVDNLSIKDAQQRMAKNFRESAARPLFSGTAVSSTNFPI